MERIYSLKNIDPKFYASDFYDINVNKYGVKCGTSLRFWEKIKIGLITQILMVGSSGILDRQSSRNKNKSFKNIL